MAVARACGRQACHESSWGLHLFHKLRDVSPLYALRCAQLLPRPFRAAMRGTPTCAASATPATHCATPRHACVGCCVAACSSLLLWLLCWQSSRKGNEATQTLPQMFHAPRHPSAPCRSARPHPGVAAPGVAAPGAATAAAAAGVATAVAAATRARAGAGGTEAELGKAGGLPEP